jgi:hypothetical protein
MAARLVDLRRVRRHTHRAAASTKKGQEIASAAAARR